MKTILLLHIYSHWGRIASQFTSLFVFTIVSYGGPSVPMVAVVFSERGFSCPPRAVEQNIFDRGLTLGKQAPVHISNTFRSASCEILSPLSRCYMRDTPLLL